MNKSKPTHWLSKVNGETFKYDEYLNVESDGYYLIGNDRVSYKALPKKLYPYSVVYEDYTTRKSLNNYSKTFKNFYFWVENESLIVKLYGIDNGRVINFKNKHGKSMFRIDNTKNEYLFDEILYFFFNIKCKDNFIKIYNKYIRSYCDKYKISDDEYPLDFDTIVSISNLDDKMYDIKIIISDLLENKKITDYKYYIKDKINLDVNIITMIIKDNPTKFTEYKNGKVGIINMFFGLYLKQMDNSKIDKEMLLSQIKDFMASYLTQ